MATLSVGREEMYTQPVSAERIRPILSGTIFVDVQLYEMYLVQDNLLNGSVSGFNQHLLQH